MSDNEGRHDLEILRPLPPKQLLRQLNGQDWTTIKEYMQIFEAGYYIKARENKHMFGKFVTRERERETETDKGREREYV